MERVGRASVKRFCCNDKEKEEEDRDLCSRSPVRRWRRSVAGLCLGSHVEEADQYCACGGGGPGGEVLKDGGGPEGAELKDGGGPEGAELKDGGGPCSGGGIICIG